MTEEQHQLRRIELYLQECDDWALPIDDIEFGPTALLTAKKHEEGVCSCKDELWYYSFADDKQFLGAAVVYAKGNLQGVRKTHLLNINGGGQVLGMRLPDDMDVPRKLIGKLLSKADLVHAGWAKEDS